MIDSLLGFREKLLALSEIVFHHDKKKSILLLKFVSEDGAFEKTFERIEQFRISIFGTLLPTPTFVPTSDIIPELTRIRSLILILVLFWSKALARRQLRKRSSAWHPAANRTAPWL